MYSVPPILRNQDLHKCVECSGKEAPPPLDDPLSLELRIQVLMRKWLDEITRVSGTVAMCDFTLFQKK